MNIIKNVWGGRLVRLPEVKEEHQCGMPCAQAYKCFACEWLQDGAANGRCNRCGSRDLHSVSQAFTQHQNPLLQRMKEAQARKRQRMRLSLAVPPSQAMTDNAARYLTERELGQDTPEREQP